MSKTEIDMKKLAQEVFDDLVVEAPERDIKFKVKTGPPTYGDKSMIRQVLINLLGNAIKFTRTKKKAVIEFGYEPKKNGLLCEGQWSWF